eukprot:1172954-Pyramimonas_sp.AAC.1
MEAPRLEPELEDGQTTMHSVSVRSCYHSAVSACPERGQWARGRTNVCQRGPQTVCLKQYMLCNPCGAVYVWVVQAM